MLAINFMPLLGMRAKPSEEEAKGIRDNFTGLLNSFDKYLGNKQFVTGDKFTLADMLMF
jgi:glutathione S-transferase